MRNDILKNKIENLSLAKGLHFIADSFRGKVVFSSAMGQEDQVITDCIFRNQIPIQIFTLDTGRLFSDTYELIERTNARYQQSIKVYFPSTTAVEKLVEEKGINCFYESVENRKSCCRIRKIEPLKRALTGMNVWITGLRGGQSANRGNMSVIEWDENYQLYKFNPLINWSYDEVVNYLKEQKVPYNHLHDQGFLSIGCAPCTRAIKEGEDIRAGRWWWETSQKECGLHQITERNKQ